MNGGQASSIWITLTPAVFLLLWGTGFVGAKFGLPYAEPLTFLFWRFIIVVALMFAVAIAMGAPWPKSGMEAFHSMVAGMFLHGFYLGGVFWAIDQGMPAGVSALIVGLQPIITAIIAGLILRETVTLQQWVGLLIGLAGLGLVLGPRLPGGGLTWGNEFALFLNVVALVGITAGTIYQKVFVSDADLRTGSVMQYLGAANVVGLGVLLFEEGYADWTWELIGVMAWLILALSIGAISLLMMLIRRGAISKVATLFYLVPAVTVTMTWLAFDEALTFIQIGGVGVTVFAVWLATKAGPKPA